MWVEGKKVGSRVLYRGEEGLVCVGFGGVVVGNEVREVGRVMGGRFCVL